MSYRAAQLITALAWAITSTMGCTGVLGEGTGDVVQLDGEITEGGEYEPDAEDRATFTTYSLPVGETVEVCHVNYGLNNRSGPSTSYRILRVLHGGKRVQTVRRSGNWYRLKVDGAYGWSYGKYLCVPSKSTSVGSGNGSGFGLPLNKTVKVCHVVYGLNNRTGPSTNHQILRSLPPGTLAKPVQRSGDWYRLNISGVYGWSYGYYLCPTSATMPSSNGGSSGSSGGSSGAYGLSRSGIINTAKAWVGFSYWWGGAAFPDPWKSMSGYSRGKCYSSTYGGHSGSYGGDCSGYAGKVWHIPSAMPYTSNRHPYSTYHFKNQADYWSHISRGSAQRADAMVYNNGGGHILIYESGDPWGQAWAYESRGCSYGVVHNLRTISSKYQAIRRKGL